MKLIPKLKTLKSKKKNKIQLWQEKKKQIYYKQILISRGQLWDAMTKSWNLPLKE